MAVSLSAQLFVLPLLAFYFNRLPLIGAVANLVITPLITIVLALGLLSVILGMISVTLAQWVAYSNWLAIEGLLRTTDFLSFSESPTLSGVLCPYVDTFPSWILLVYYPALISLPYIFRNLNANREQKWPDLVQ